MNNNILSNSVFTPEQVAQILQVSEATVYKLIKNGEIIAKKLGNIYRIPRTSLAFVFEGLDFDLLQAAKVDMEKLEMVHAAISAVRGKQAK